MLLNSFVFNPTLLHEGILKWKFSFFKSKNSVHQMVSEGLELLLTQNQGDLCFKLIVNSEAKEPTKWFNKRLKIICLLNNYIRYIAHFFFGISIMPFLGYILINDIFKNVMSMIVYFLIYYVVFIFLTFSTGIGLTMLIQYLKIKTPVRHPHLVYISKVIINGVLSYKIVYKDNELFYGKNQKDYKEIVITNNKYQSKGMDKKELIKILYNIAYADDCFVM